MTWCAEMACKYVGENLNSGMDLETLFDNARNNYKLVRDQAGDIGSCVHSLIEKNIKGEWVDCKNLLPEVKKCFFSFLAWKKKYNVKFLLTEKTVHSKIHGFAGTFDALIEREGKRYIVDWKTSGAIHDTFGPQVSAYICAARELGIEVHGGLVVRFCKLTGKFEIKDYSQNQERHMNSFLHLLSFFYSFKSRRINNPRTVEGSRIAVAA